MYLSCLELDPRCRQVRAELRNAYEMHRTLSKAFGDERLQWDAARCLFRVEEEPQVRVLVQSRFAPDWGCLSVSPDYLCAPPTIKSIEFCFAAGQTFAFRLRANPTVKRNGDKNRVGLYGEQEQLEWLRRKADAAGFRLQQAVLSKEEAVVCRVVEGQQAQFSAVRFDGILDVIDPTLFLSAVEGGVGAGKGVGFGLLSLARPTR